MMKRGALILTVLLALWPRAFAGGNPRDLLAAGRVDEAIQILQLQVGRSGDDAESYNLLCRAYYMIDDWDHGISACERAVMLDPNKSLYHLWLARVYGEKADRAGIFKAAGMASKVRTHFERAVQIDPQSWEARTDLAEFYMEAPGIVGGGRDKAQAEANSLLPLNPAMGHWVLGRLAEKNKDEVTAENEYRAEIESSEGSARAWLDLAIFYRHTGRLDEMEQALSKMQTRPLDRPESLMDGASCLLRAGRNYPLGVKLVERYLSETTVEAGPRFKAHYLLGELLEKQGDRQGAAEQYRASLALAHGYSRAQAGLKRVHQ